MTFGSLFAGIGGLDLGLERAGMKCKWQVEIDDYARRVLAKHWPNVSRHADICTFYPTSDANVDLICGGFPCKQTSVASAVHGRRQGLHGKDSGLWFQMLRVVNELQPKWVIVENTPGAATWQSEVRRGLEDCGYVVPQLPIQLSAWNFGAPHLRRRLFWVADRDGKGLEIARQIRSSSQVGGERFAAARSGWESVPRNLRMDNGFYSRPHRRDRIRCLGNAVVPQVAEYLGREIMRHAEAAERTGVEFVHSRPTDVESPQ